MSKIFQDLGQANEQNSKYPEAATENPISMSLLFPENFCSIVSQRLKFRLRYS